MTQIILCNVEMYAVFREEDGKETKSRVLAFGLYHDGGDVVPLIFDPVLGISETNLMHFDRYEMGSTMKGEEEQIEQLKRIANVLEDINGALISMGGNIEALGDCVGTAPARYVGGREYRFLRISGSVDTGM